MQINIDSINAQYKITSYNSNTIFVNQIPYTKSFIITPDSLQEWDISQLSQVSLADIKILKQFNSNIIIIGTGPSMLPLSNKQVEILCKEHCAIDFMSTAAACRTYSILAAEERNFVMGLII